MRNVNDYYWMNRNKLRKLAVEHTYTMHQLYQIEIEHSLKNSQIINKLNLTIDDSKRTYNTNIILEDIDTVKAIFKYIGDNTVVLNFASYTSPGGKFIDGSSAQEECLCHSSILYNILNEFKRRFYIPHKKTLNKGLYTDELIYTPDVLFVDEDYLTTCNVITCAAPNAGVSKQYHNISDDVITETMTSRIDNILATALVNNNKCLILGAFGCGVFRNNPHTVASIFKTLLDNKYKNVFEKVIFAIPMVAYNCNYETFKDVLCKED